MALIVVRSIKRHNTLVSFNCTLIPSRLTLPLTCSQVLKPQRYVSTLHPVNVQILTLLIHFRTNTQSPFSLLVLCVYI